MLCDASVCTSPPACLPACLLPSLCRYATVVPLSKSSLGKLKHTASSLRNAIYSKRRPHYVFGSQQYRQQGPPLCFPPLPPSFFQEAPPLEGQLSAPRDRKRIEQLVKELKPFLATHKLGYEGKKNALGQLHGKGELAALGTGHWALGCISLHTHINLYINLHINLHIIIYICTTCASLCIIAIVCVVVRVGSFRFSSGNKYDGLYKNNKRDGYGKFVFANGELRPARCRRHANSVTDYMLCCAPLPAMTCSHVAWRLVSIIA